MTERPLTSKSLPSASLRNLEGVTLTPSRSALLDRAMQSCHGSEAIRNRKQAEAFELLALSQIAPPGRLHIEFLDLREHLRAMIHVEVPVACQPDQRNQLQIADRAVLGFTYPTEGFGQPLPGSAFFEILLPRNVWLAQVAQPHQALCIAPQVAAGTRTAMLLLRAYGALSMQSIQVDVRDAAGVFDASIARWWQHHLDRVPLTTTALLEPIRPEANDVATTIGQQK